MQNQNGQLGQIVSWRVPAQVAVSALRGALVAAGLDPDLAPDLGARHVLSRALRDMREGRVITRLARIDADRVSFQLTRELALEDHAEYEREAVVTLDLRSGAVSADDAAIEQRARELVTEHAAKRLANDISRMIQRIFDERRADLVPIREQGGAYFVPDRHRDLVDATRTLLAAIGGRLQSFSVRLGCADTAESVAEAMAEHMLGMIAELRTSCEAINAESRADAKARRMQRVADLRQRLACYRDILAAHADGIGRAIADAEAELLAAITRPAADAPSAPAPMRAPARPTTGQMALV